MSAAAGAFASSPTPNSVVQFRITRNKIFVNAIPTFRTSSRFLRNSCGYKRRSISTTSIRRFSTVMEWQDCTDGNDLGPSSEGVVSAIMTAQDSSSTTLLRRSLCFRRPSSHVVLRACKPPMVAGSQIPSTMDFFALKLHSSYRAKLEVDVPCSVAYNCYSDRESIPRWMPFISSVKILEDKPDLSRWSLKYTAFGRDLEFSWLAQNFQPIPNQKIHWRSLEGLPNRGVVRFYPKGPSSCIVDLTVSYEVPQILVPVASALQPFLEQLLLRGLESFANVAKIY